MFIQQYLFILILLLFFSSCSILLGNFLVTPVPMTVTRGSVSKFSCSADADAMSFRVNGTSVNVLDNPDIVTISLPGMEPRIHMLHIIANEEYNNTRVQCIATDFSSGLIIFSNETVLIIQGKGNFSYSNKFSSGVTFSNEAVLIIQEPSGLVSGT